MFLNLHLLKAVAVLVVYFTEHLVLNKLYIYGLDLQTASFYFPL